MSWFSRIFGSKADEQHPSDPILSKCRSIEREYNLLIDEQEQKHLLVNRDKLAESSLRGLYVQPDVFHVLCFLCLYDALCETGVELLETVVGQLKRSKKPEDFSHGLLLSIH